MARSTNERIEDLNIRLSVMEVQTSLLSDIVKKVELKLDTNTGDLNRLKSMVVVARVLLAVFVPCAVYIFEKIKPLLIETVGKL